VSCYSYYKGNPDLLYLIKTKHRGDVDSGKGFKSLRFVRQLLDMMSDPTLEEYISWNDDGNSVVIPDSAAFEKEVLQTTKFSRWV
jgi:hypothetical protein